MINKPCHIWIIFYSFETLRFNESYPTALVSLFGNILPFEFLFQMVGSTRGTPEGFSHGQASGSQQPPPPPRNLVKVMALQTELLRQLVQGQ